MEIGVKVALPSAADYVDLLEFANFGGKPWPLAPGVSPPTRYFFYFFFQKYLLILTITMVPL